MLTLESRIRTGPSAMARLGDGSGIRSGFRASWRCSASIARSPLYFGLNFFGPISTVAGVVARYRDVDSEIGAMRPRAQGGALINAGSVLSSRCIGELMIASLAFKLRSHEESVDFLQLLTFADCNVTNSYDSCPLAAQEGIGSHRELPTGRVGVQTFAGLGAVDLSRYWRPTGALGRTAELQGLSCDRQNRCQYGPEVAGTAAASVPSRHPRAADPTPFATHTKW